MNKKFVVRLSVEERSQLESLVAKGKAAARKLTRARILLKADCSTLGSAWSDEQISDALDLGASTVHRVRRSFVEGGLDGALIRRPVPRRRRMLDGEQEAHLIALACGSPPHGSVSPDASSLGGAIRRTGLLRRKVSHETIRRDAQKNESKPWLVKMWCIPPTANAEFFWKREDVLSSLQTSVRSASTRRLHGRNQQATHRRDTAPSECGRRVDLVAWTHMSICCKGVADPLHVLRELCGWRRIWITPQRRKVEWAWCVKQLLNEDYPDAERLVLVCDNLNTHTGGALYEAFPAAEARRLWERLEVYHTPPSTAVG